MLAMVTARTPRVPYWALAAGAIAHALLVLMLWVGAFYLNFMVVPARGRLAWLVRRRDAL